jgi:hypothetical protein
MNWLIIERSTGSVVDVFSTRQEAYHYRKMFYTGPAYRVEKQ